MNLVLVVEEVPVGVAVGRREEGFDGKLVWKEFEHHAEAENGNDEENTALLWLRGSGTVPMTSCFIY